MVLIAPRNGTSDILRDDLKAINVTLNILPYKYYRTKVSAMYNNDAIESMLTVSEVAQLLHIHPNTLRRWSNEGRLNAFRITPRGDRRFKKQDVDRFLSQLNSYSNQNV
jgi:excisionase family DNA binding protein